MVSLTPAQRTALRAAQRAFDKLCSTLPDARTRHAFRSWAEERLTDLTAPPLLLYEIAHALRPVVPANQHAPGETLVFPDHGENADCHAEQTVQVDAFVYDDDALDELVAAGTVPRSACVACGSHRVRDLPVISHSLSVPQLQYVFETLLGPDLVDGKTVLDIGSRVGAVLFGGYALTQAAHLVGVELHAAHCDIARRIVADFALGDRVEIVHGDVREHAALFARADVVVLNNVFEFFADAPLQRDLWTFVLAECRKRPGLLIVSNPPLQEALATADMADTAAALAEWLLELPVDENVIDVTEDTESFHLYRVLLGGSA